MNLEQMKNKVHCSDCLEFMKDIPDKSIDLVLTDPPYGVDWQSNRRETKHSKIENDNNCNWLFPVFNEVYRILKDNSLCVSFYGWPEVDKFMSVFKSVGFLPKSHIVWVKDNIGLGWFTRGQHESAFLLAKGSPKKPNIAISDIQKWKGTGNKLHPTQKPVGALIPVIKTYSEENDLILDPFLGSGTTAIACQELHRNFIGIEISEKYCKIAEDRLKQKPLF